MTENQPVGSPQWQEWRRVVDLDDYESRWDQMADRGENPHGEVDYVMRFAPASALDAGCGFGRVGIELAQRGVDVVGVDLDPDLLDRARRRAPNLDWRLADLAFLDLGRQFELVVVAGNVIGYVQSELREAAVRSCARHVEVGGYLVMGNQLKASWPTITELDSWCASEGLVVAGHQGGWDGEVLVADSRYVVTVHQRL